MILHSVFSTCRRLFIWLGSVLLIYMAIYFVCIAIQVTFISQPLVNEFYGKEENYIVPALEETQMEKDFDMQGYLHLRTVIILYLNTLLLFKIN